MNHAPPPGVNLPPAAPAGRIHIYKRGRTAGTPENVTVSGGREKCFIPFLFRR